MHLSCIQIILYTEVLPGLVFTNFGQLLDKQPYSSIRRATYELVFLWIFISPKIISDERQPLLITWHPYSEVRWWQYHVFAMFLLVAGIGRLLGLASVHLSQWRRPGAYSQVWDCPFSGPVKAQPWTSAEHQWRDPKKREWHQPNGIHVVLWIKVQQQQTQSSSMWCFS